MYLIVNEGPLSGEIHIRFSDLNKAISLDDNSDGIIADDEVFENYAAIANYLSSRVKLFDESRSHDIIAGEMEFFGPDAARQMLLRFSVPSIDPPPDALGAQFRFLYDALDPEHRPMLLIKSNTRTGLEANESMVSLVFEPGADRQVVDLSAPPFGRVISDVFSIGLERTVLNGFQVAAILMVFLGSLRWWGRPQARATQGLTGLARNAALTATVIALGFAAGLMVSDALGFSFNKHHTKNVLAAALGLAAVSTLVETSTGRRLLLVFIVGAFCGATQRSFNAVFGLNVGFIELAFPVFVAAVFLACCLLAAAILPLGSVLYRSFGSSDRVIRWTALVVLIIAILFLFQRLVL